jgi:DNA-directed RNA polymerase specialized sigma24 family protein
VGGQLCDAEALRRLRHDPDAITAIYDRHVARLVAALAHLGGDRETAFDVGQETFARLLDDAHRLRVPNGESVGPWLWTVARNLLRDSQRRAAVFTPNGVRCPRGKWEPTFVALDADRRPVLESKILLAQSQACIAGGEGTPHGPHRNRR